MSGVTTFEIILEADGDFARVLVEPSMAPKLLAALQRHWQLPKVASTKTGRTPAATPAEFVILNIMVPPYQVAEVIRQFVRNEVLPHREVIEGRVIWRIVVP